jgi:hypothetical protein
MFQLRPVIVALGHGLAQNRTTIKAKMGSGRSAMTNWCRAADLL